MPPMPEKNTLWKFISQAPDCPPHQVHLVVMTSKAEVVTIGMPYGHGGTWLGSPAELQKQFVYAGKFNQPASE